LQKIRIIAIPIFLCLLLLFKPAISQETPKDDLRKRAQETAVGLYVPQPDLLSPVSLNAGVVWSGDKKQVAVILKVEVLENWHIYAYVPPDQPYIQSEVRLPPIEGLIPIGEWEMPGPFAYGDGIYIYKGSLHFIRYFSVIKTGAPKTFDVGLYYQTCDISQCLPPELEEIKLSF
jgi:hypothetical protein